MKKENTIEKIITVAINTNNLLDKLDELAQSSYLKISEGTKNVLNFEYSVILEGIIELNAEGRYKLIFDGIRAQAEPIKTYNVDETIVLLQNLQTILQNYCEDLHEKAEIQILFDVERLKLLFDGNNRK